MASWRRQMKANSLYVRGDFATAAGLFEEIVGADPSDGFAAFMLAMCYERQERLSDALHWAEKAAARLPDSVPALQSAVRLAIVAGDHEKATGFFLQALALPEVTTEMPRGTLLPRPIVWLLSALSHMPYFRRRIRPGALAALQPGHRAVELQRWKEWARAYLAWRNGDEGAPPQSLPS